MVGSPGLRRPLRNSAAVTVQQVCGLGFHVNVEMFSVVMYCLKTKNNNEKNPHLRWGDPLFSMQLTMQSVLILTSVCSYSHFSVYLHSRIHVRG